MQMCPGDDHAQQCYTGVPYDEVDYHYNNNNAFSHQSMQKPLEKGVPHRKHSHAWVPKHTDVWDDNYENYEYSYKGDSNLEMKPNHQWMPPQDHDYNYKYDNMHGYGWHDPNSHNFTYGHEDHMYHGAQYFEGLCESDKEYDHWNGRSDYFGLGKNQNTKKHSSVPFGVEKGGGYGAHHGPHMLMAKQQPYHVPLDENSCRQHL